MRVWQGRLQARSQGGFGGFVRNQLHLHRAHATSCTSQRRVSGRKRDPNPGSEPRTSPVNAVRYCTRTRRMQFVWARTLRERSRSSSTLCACACNSGPRTGKAWVPKLSRLASDLAVTPQLLRLATGLECAALFTQRGPQVF